MLRGWCFIAMQNLKLKHITRCELWKRQIQPWIVTLLFGTIQCWFCLFHSSHLVVCFNLKFCVAIKHYPLNIPYFFSDFLKTSKHLFLVVFIGFHRMLVSVPPRPQPRPLSSSERHKTCMCSLNEPGGAVLRLMSQDTWHIVSSTVAWATVHWLR